MSSRHNISDSKPRTILILPKPLKPKKYNIILFIFIFYIQNIINKLITPNLFLLFNKHFGDMAEIQVISFKCMDIHPDLVVCTDTNLLLEFFEDISHF